MKRVKRITINLHCQNCGHVMRLRPSRFSDRDFITCPDCKQEFIHAANKALSVATENLRIAIRALNDGFDKDGANWGLSVSWGSSYPATCESLEQSGSDRTLLDGAITRAEK